MKIPQHQCLFLLLLCSFDNFVNVNADAFQDLYSRVLTDYNMEIIPRCSPSRNLTVTVGAALREIIDLIEVEQMIKVKLWIRLKWKDCYFVWNTTEYEGIKHITFRSTGIWTPDITLYQSANEGASMPGVEDYRVTVYSDGQVIQNYPTTVTFSCSIDVSYFPYDTQNCSLSLGSWTQNGNIIDILKDSDSGDLSSFLPNNEWKVISMNNVRNVLYYGCCPEPYPDVTFHLVIRRKPVFYFVTLIFPCVLVLGLAGVGFILPAESGEKMSLQITVLLSLAVFLLIMSDKLPAAADNFPIAGIYFAVSMALVTISCLLTVLVLWMHYRDGSTTRVPLLLRKHCLERSSSHFHNLDIAKKENAVDCVSVNLQGKSSDGVAVSLDKTDMKSEGAHATEDKENNVIDEERIRKEWNDLARVSDKVILGFYLFTSTITTCVFIGVLADHN